MKKLAILALLVGLSLVLAGCGLPGAGDTVEVSGVMPEIKVGGKILNPSGGDPGSVAPPGSAPSTGVASIQIAGHPVLEVPELRGPFYPEDYPELWQDGGASVVVTGDLFANADDQIWWKLTESEEWTVLTEKVEDYTQILPGSAWMYVRDLGGDGTHVSFLERDPSGQSPPVSQPPSIVNPPPSGSPKGTITIGGILVQVPPMAGPYHSTGGDFPSLWSDAGAEIDVTGNVFVQADDAAQWHNGDGQWRPLTTKVSEYGEVPQGRGFLRILNYGGNWYVKFVEIPPPDGQ